ncbi:hypothetical protein [Puniceicoccus vermicola]|uniref:Uncharacterized protein n=1 Tax=Puniceicoccus vermicola TaxID=388746 RepID=A0A7X1B1X7_9BACT|nr:hypothetical protein [Puniceicoccus vermicola]MBC2602970.1 hypothetical protein [Puniceicoccus vermicola]
MFQSIKTIPCCLLVSLILNIGHAQDVSPESIFQLSWRGISVGKTIDDLYIGNPESGFQRVYIPNGAFSAEYSYRGTAPMYFYRLSEVSGRQVHTPVGALPINSNLKGAALFINPDSSNKKVTVNAIPIDWDKLVNGQTRLVNLTSETVAGFLGGTRFALDPMQTEIIPFDAASSGVIKVTIQLAVREETGWQPKLNSTFGVTDDMCVNLLITQKTNGSIEMIPLRERKQPPQDVQN